MKLFVFGTKGRMSQAIQKLAQAHPDIELINQPEKNCVLIDFTAPAAIEANLKIALQNQAAYIIGTTGLGQDQFKQLENAAKKIPVLQAPNTSLAMNLLFELAHISSKVLAQFDISIQDIHHQHKKDAPSGTALALQKAVGRNCKINSVRAGETVGIHEVLFSSPYETLSLKHEAMDRKVYAEGALLASFFLSKQKPGLYSMKDVLGLP